MIDKNAVITKLEDITSKIVSIAIKDKEPLVISNKMTVVGNLAIRKNINGLYDIMSIDNTRIYESISILEIAVIIAQRYNSGEMSIVKQILQLEEKYLKHHLDMIHYLHCIKLAKKKSEYDRISILEDKLQTAQIHLKMIKEKINFFKKLK